MLTSVPMIHWTSGASAVLAAFMASLVEFVEALTVVLAVGAVRGWRSALLGSGAAFVALAVAVALLGPALMQVSVHAVRAALGVLLLWFGLRWLIKAVRRAAGTLALHDEAQVFDREKSSLLRAGVAAQTGGAATAVAAAFKIVTGEGAEVVFIVIGVGAGGGLLLPAALGALLALLAVAALGLWLHRPLTRIPENALKFAVGVLVSAFGVFWIGEGFGILWPGGDWALLAVAAVLSASALVAVMALRRGRRAS